MQVLLDILEWSTQLPDWERDALRRAVTQNEITEADFDEVLTLLKITKGALAPSEIAPAPRPFSSTDIGTQPDDLLPVRLESLYDLENVNALAPCQRLSFGELGLTVVYGDNAAGKSGYARVLKRACRARGEEEVLPDVTEQPAGHPRATFDVRHGEEMLTIRWEEGQPTPDELAQVAVFDTRCARITLSQANKLDYVPYGLDVLPRLANMLTRIGERLRKEVAEVQRSPAPLPDLPASTSAGKFLASLALPLDALRALKELASLTSLDPAERRRLDELQGLADVLRASDPAVEAPALRRQSKRVLTTAETLEKWEERVTDSALSDVGGLRAAFDAVAVAEEASEQLTRKTLVDSQLPGVGGSAWRTMIAAAVDYVAAELELEQPLAAAAAGARCPLCQQALTQEAAERLHRYLEFIKSAVSAEAQRRRAEFDAARQALAAAGTPSSQVAGETIDEIGALDEDVRLQLTTFLAALDHRTTQTLSACTDGSWAALSELSPSPTVKLRELSALIERQAQAVEESGDPEKRAQTLAAYDGLRAREQLSEQATSVRARIAQLQAESTLAECISSTDTTAVSRFSSRLTQQAITEELEKALQGELVRLGSTDLRVGLKRSVASGVPHHTLEMSHVCHPKAKVDQVLSEGEHRVLAIAAFLAELSLTSPRCSIVLDDPVCSLDHIYREKVAKRLVQEAGNRQVVIFTHDLVFLLALASYAGGHCTMVTHTVRRGPDGTGVCDPDSLPWAAMTVKKRLGVLRRKHQNAAATFRRGDLPSYNLAAGELYCLLRETWERAVEEVLLNDAVQRMRPDIKTLSLREVTVGEQDYIRVHAGMTKCSTCMLGHDTPAARSTPMPNPDGLASDIDDLDAFRKDILAKRSSS